MAIEFEDIDNVVDRCMRYLPESAPHEEVISKIYDVANQLEEWEILVDDEQSINILANDISFDVAPTVDATNVAAIGIKTVAIEERPLTKKTEGWLDANISGWRYRDPGSAQYFYVDRTRNNYANGTAHLRLDMQADTAITGGLKVKAVLKSIPASPNRKLATIYREFNDIIELGVASEMMMMPDKKWTNERKAMLYGKQFHFLKQSLIAKHHRGHTSGSVGVQLKRWV